VMVDAVQIYVDYVNSLCEDGTDVGIEKRFNLSKIHKDLGGTCDCLLWHPERNHLDVIDFKYGRGVPVDVDGNSQMLIYGLGAIYDLIDRGVVEFIGLRKDHTVTLHVVQPRAKHKDGPVRKAEYTWGFVDDWIEEVLIPAVKRCDDPNAKRVPGNCKFCRAEAVCPERNAGMKAAIKADFDDDYCELVKPNALSMSDIETILTHSTKIRDWLNSVEEYAQAMVVKGKHTFEKFKLVRAGTQRRYINPKQAEKILKEVLKEKAYKSTLITPAQAEKLVGKKAIESLVETPDGALRLEPRDSKKTEVFPDKCLEFLDSHDLLQ